MSKPVLFDIDAQTAPSPATAPPVPDTVPEGRAMQSLVQLGGRKPSRLLRFFWAATLGLIGFAASVAAYDFVTGLIARNPVLGGTALVLVAAFVLGLSLMALRELAGFARLRRLDGLRTLAEVATRDDDLKTARRAVAGLERLYAGRDDLKWALARLQERKPEVLDADGLLALAETELLTPIDTAAIKEVESAARQVATVTALVPLALADLIAALAANLRMIRRVAELYGGRSGTLGNLRLARAVLTHLVATGAVAVGDDMLGSFAGGGVLSKLSRRFGEGLVNGALTARVGVAAIETCRPLPFAAAKRPSVGKLVSRALSGLFGKES